MIKRKGKFLTFCFSLIPGAGHMYLGFMKQGLSLMTLLCATCFFSFILNMGPLLFFLPVLWFYSFFDALNKNSMKDEDFYKLEDNYLFNMDFSSFSSLLQGKFRNVFAITFILIGISLLFSNFTYMSRYIFGWGFYNVFSYYFGRIPQLILAIFIIFVGIRLIQGKKIDLLKHECNLDNSTVTTIDDVIVENSKEES